MLIPSEDALSLSPQVKIFTFFHMEKAWKLKWVESM
jgi:hypothetical protein